MRWVKRTWAVAALAAMSVVGVGWLLLVAVVFGLTAGFVWEVWRCRDQWAGSGRVGGC